LGGEEASRSGGGDSGQDRLKTFEGSLWTAEKRREEKHKRRRKMSH
jgi:hypothetical protein